MRLFARKTIVPPIDGYETGRLVDVVVRKTAAITDVDGLPAPEIRLATLAALALSGDRVLDFGGAAGLHYRVARHSLPKRPFRWAVIETVPMVSRARAMEGEGLRFFPTVAEARDWLGGVDLMHSVGALQYTAEPERTLADLMALGAPVMLWAKLDLGERRETLTQRSLLSENGPGPLPDGIQDAEVFYRLTRMCAADFHAAHRGYRAAWQDTTAFLFTRH